MDRWIHRSVAAGDDLPLVDVVADSHHALRVLPAALLQGEDQPRRNRGRRQWSEARILFVGVQVQTAVESVQREHQRVPSGLGQRQVPRFSRTGSIAMQSTGQGAIHNSQPVHSEAMTVCISLAAPRMASTGQA